MTLLFWSILIHSAVSVWQHRNAPAMAMQPLAIAILAVLAWQLQSPPALLACLLLTLLGTFGLVRFQRRLWEAVHTQDFKRVRSLNRWTPVLLWGQSGRRLAQEVEAACEGDFSPLRRMALLSNQRDWAGVRAIYQQLAPPLDCWTHLVAARACARQGDLVAAADCLDRTRWLRDVPPPHWPALYASMVFSLAGSLPHLDFWLERLPQSSWPASSRLHARALCLDRSGQRQAALEVWEQARLIAPPDFLPYIEADLENTQIVMADAPLLQRMQEVFVSLFVSTQLSRAPLGRWGTCLLVVTLLAYLLHPDMTGFVSLNALQNGEYWRLLSHLFSHYDLAHLTLNMLVLAGLSGWVEAFYGWRILVIYFLSGIVAALVQVACTPLGYLVGASGGVLALYGARLASLLRIPYLNKGYQIKLMLGCLLVQCLADQLIPHVGAAAHLTGLVVGLGLGLLLPQKKGLFLG